MNITSLADAEIGQNADLDLVKECLGALTDRELQVVEKRHPAVGKRTTLFWIGVGLGVTGERVRQIYVKSARKVRRRYGAEMRYRRENGR